MMSASDSDSQLVAEIRERALIISQRFNHDPRKYLDHLKAAQSQHPDRLVSQITVVAAQPSPQR